MFKKESIADFFILYIILSNRNFAFFASNQFYFYVLVNSYVLLNLALNIMASAPVVAARSNSC